MCIIIDTNCLADVFSSKSKKHKAFKPVLDWIINGIGKMVVGGTKYRSEIEKNDKVRKLVSVLNQKAKKVILLDDRNVDLWQRKIEKLITDTDFDDPHLPAMVIVGKCQLICSGDTRSIKYVCRKDIYPKGISIPKYYTKANNKDLLCTKYIDKKYKPYTKCNKLIKNNIFEVLDKM